MGDNKRDVQAYMNGVLSGEIVAGRLVRLAVMRHKDDLKNAKKRGFEFDEDAANEACDFFPLVVRHSTGEWAGQPANLEIWQKFILWVLFGWRRKSDGTRRFRKAHIELGRKNGKTFLASGIGNKLLVLDNPPEPRAEIYCVATKEDQAKILWSEARRTIKASPSLKKRVQIFAKSLSTPDESFFKPIGSDSDTSDGFNPHAVLLDELHAWRETHRGLHEVLTTGGASRRQPLELAITTAGDDRSYIWKEERDYCVRVLEGVISGEIVDDTRFAYIAAIDDKEYADPTTGEMIEADDPFDENVWGKANPNLGVSVKLDYLRNQATEAKNNPAKKSKFLRYHCNVMTSSSERAIDPVLWAKCAEPTRIKPQKVGYGAIDLARTNDFSAASMVFPEWESKPDDEGKLIESLASLDILSKSWTAADRSDELKSGQFARWVNEGKLKEHSGDQIDFYEILRQVVEWSDQYNIKTWAFDPAFATIFAQRLQEDHGLTVFKFTQSPFHYNTAVREFLNAVRKGIIRHGGDPVLTWQAGNLIIEKNNRDLWMPSKSHSQGKIDAMVSVLMAFSECLYHKDGDQNEGSITFI